MGNYTVTLIHYADYEVTADSAEEAEKIATSRAGSPDSDWYYVECVTITEEDA